MNFIIRQHHNGRTVWRRKGKSRQWRCQHATETLLRIRALSFLGNPQER
ncbi:MAG: hypothetical protein ACLVFT_00685 [Megasphaera lornae]